MAELRKMMIVNLLGRRFGFESYLELATPSTGRFYAQVDRDYFKSVARMMYVTPFALDDGLPVDFRSPDEDISGVLEEFRASGRRVDISLVDGWHTYQDAYRDLVQFFDLLSDGGVLVVHDCMPESREGASARFRLGNWWVQSYKAFLDFVLRTPSLDYFTLDCDHGCGMIIKNRQFDAVLGQEAAEGWLPSRPTADLVARWFESGADADLAYDFFEARRSELLRLVPAERFLTFFSDAELDLARKPLMPPATPSALPVQVAPSAAPGAARKRQSLASMLLRALNRKLAAMPGQQAVAAPEKAKSGTGDPGKG